MQAQSNEFTNKDHEKYGEKMSNELSLEGLEGMLKNITLKVDF